MPDKIIAKVRESHARQLALCAELEGVADSLPAAVDRQLCLHLARAVCRTVSEAQAVEERLLFPAVEAKAGHVADPKSTVERLRWEHMTDLCVAEEIHDALLGLGRDEDGIAYDAVGYMLRGFFESVRRHVAFERELLAPLLVPPAGGEALSRSAS